MDCKGIGLSTSWWQEAKRRNVVRVGIAYAVVGWIAAQIGLMMFDTFEAPGWVAKVLVSLIVLGLPFALLFAWAFELTPEGLKRSDEVDPDASITKKTGRKVDYVIIAALLAAVAVLGWDKLQNSGQPETVAQVPADTPEPPVGGGNKGASIAVLPFADMSPQRDQEYFSDGISEELLNLLARMPGLRVAARTSSFAFKGREQDIRQIAEALDVSKILEGSVRKAGTQLRITAQLIDAENGYHLWSDTYDRELDDVFAIQDEIAAAIVAALEQTLKLGQGAPASTRSSSVEAYNAYLEGRHLMEQRGQGPLEKAMTAFEKAIALDPGYAPAYSSLAETILLLRDSGASYGDIPTAEAIERATPLVERAMTLAPDSADTHVARGFLLDTDRRNDEAIAAYDKALELNPNLVRALMWRGQVYGRVGRFDEQLESIRKAVELDPLAYVPVQNLTVLMGQRGRYDEALEAARRLVRVRNDATSYRGGLAVLYASQGHWDQGHAMLLRAEELAPGETATARYLGWTYATLGLEEKVRELADTPLEKAYLLAMQERWAESGAAARAILETDPADRAARRAAAQAQFELGDAAGAVETLQPLVDRTQGHVGPLFDLYDPPALLLVVARRESGDEKGAQALLAELRAFYDEVAAAGIVAKATKFTEARLLTLEGREAEALPLLRNLVDSGWVTFDLMQEEALRPLHDNPVFQQIVADHDREKSRQRREVLEQLGEADAPRGGTRPVL